MHCPACVDRLTRAFRAVPGVTSAHVTLSPPEAHIESSTPVPLDALERAARGEGDYSVRNGAVTAGDDPSAHPEVETVYAAPAAREPSIYPLVLIVAFIAGTVALTTALRSTGWSWHTAMNDFMAGFFLVFSFFKFLDLRGFAGVYRTYDVVAKAWRPWGYAYPFVEAALGVAYLARWELTLTSAVTLAVMLLGSIGVLRALLRKDAIRCACLGTALNLPMTTVTLVEDLGMAAMAMAMLLWPG